MPIFQEKGEVIAGFGAILASVCILLINDPVWKLWFALLAVAIMLYGIYVAAHHEE
jgi:hypothetical protein